MGPDDEGQPSDVTLAEEEPSRRLGKEAPERLRPLAQGVGARRLGTGIARGLQAVFAPPADEMVIVAAVPGDPPDADDRVRVILDPDDPTKSIAIVPRPGRPTFGVAARLEVLAGRRSAAPTNSQPEVEPSPILPRSRRQRPNVR